MARLEDILLGVDKEDSKFVGTVAFKEEEITLPNGSSFAIGIDGGVWVAVYQEAKGAPFIIYEYNSITNKLYIDKKLGSKEDFRNMKKIIEYFFSHAHSEDLVTISPMEKING